MTTDILKYIPSTNSSPGGNSHDHKPKTVSNRRKQNEKISKNHKEISKSIQEQDSEYLNE